jgi:hypothetical protein
MLAVLMRAVLVLDVLVLAVLVPAPLHTLCPCTSPPFTQTLFIGTVKACSKLVHYL